jgi:hypothetical protein
MLFQTSQAKHLWDACYDSLRRPDLKAPMH